MSLTPETPPELSAESQSCGPPQSTAWFTAGRLSCLIALFLLVLYPGVFLGSHTFFQRDFGLFTYPVAHYTHESFWHGEVPLWNPMNNAGVPFLAQWNTTVCYPFSWLYILFPLPWSLNFFCLGHLVLAGAGMYLLAWKWTGNRLAASIAGLAFALSGLMLNSLIWTSNLAALSWQPLVILCIERAWRNGARSVFVGSIVGAVQMLSGAPEIILFTWLLIALLWVSQVRSGKIQVAISLRRLAIVALFVAGLAAVQILPFLDLLAHCKRDPSYSTESWPMPIWGWANLLVPLFHCSRTALGVYWQDGQTWTTSYYPGMGVLALALAGAWAVRESKTRCLAIIAAAGLILALGSGGYVYTWLKTLVPWIGFARYPIKFVALSAFAIPLLAAYGFHQIQSAASNNPRRGEKVLRVVTIGLLLLTILILAAARFFPKPGDSWTATWQSGLSRLLFLLAIVGVIGVLLRVQAERHRWLAAAAVLALIGLDAVTAGMHQNPTVTVQAFGPLQPRMSAVPRFGQSRAMVSARVQSFLDRADTADPAAYCVGVRDALFKNCNLLESMPKVDGFWSLQLREEMELSEVLYGPAESFPAGLADFLGVSQVSDPDKLFSWIPRRTFLPLVTGGQQVKFASPEETLAALGSQDFDARQTVYLPLTARGNIAATNGAQVQIEPQEFAAHRVRFRAAATAPAMVVIAQSYYHNWQAHVDGGPVRLWPANHGYQAVEIPAGQHEIVIAYRDRAFRAGAWISVMAGAFCLFLLTPRFSVHC